MNILYTGKNMVCREKSKLPFFSVAYNSVSSSNSNVIVDISIHVFKSKEATITKGDKY